RFSVIVKGARGAPQRLADGDGDEQPPPTHPPPRIVQAEGLGSDTGFMEISVHRAPSTTAAADNASATSAAATAAAPAAAASSAPAAAERPAYATADSIDGHSAPSHAPDSAVGSQTAMVTATEPPATRQYLIKPLEQPVDKPLDADEAAPGADHQQQQQQQPSRSLDDLDGASSMFTATDDGSGDDSTARRVQRQQQPSATTSSPADTAALLDRARREIEGLDAHAGVGLLDQTPELSYRQAAAIKKDAFDAKRRARSSSNTVVRVLSEIVRDPAGGARHIAGLASTAGSRAARAPPAGAKPSPTQEPPAAASPRTVQRHSSTGAINQASDAAAVASAAAGVVRPDVLRSHSHNASHPHRTLALPERIAELPEPPTPRELPAAEPFEANEPPAQSPTRSPSPPSSPPAASSTEPPPRADEYLKPVFLKGLFSVATTSTRSPTAIRDNLLAVLARMPLRFHEGKGYFTCSVAAAAAPANLHASASASAYAHDGLASSATSGLHRHKKSLRLPGVDRKLSFRRRREPLLDEPPSSDDVLLDPATAAEHADPPVHAPPAICFQIFLVRMPLLGLCGLQFRRVSGPAWQYKDICSDILKRLQL
ncbi:Serine/threonine-protein kinase, partial [Coemansia sp. RSA 2703]